MSVTSNLSHRDRQLAVFLGRDHPGELPRILRPYVTVAALRKADLKPRFACAGLTKESGGGRNVFGHDPTIFVGAGEVTEAKYKRYKRERGREGQGGMQGVGPMQLTWWETQDAADRRGGCWRPFVNMVIGFEHLAELIEAHGIEGGAARYNGGPSPNEQARAYGRDFARLAELWERRLDVFARSH